MELDPIYADRFSHVWLWNDWPQKGKVGDVGVTLLPKKCATGEFCAIQCKFYLPDRNALQRGHRLVLYGAGEGYFYIGHDFLDDRQMERECGIRAGEISQSR